MSGRRAVAAGMLGAALSAVPGIFPGACAAPPRRATTCGEKVAPSRHAFVGISMGVRVEITVDDDDAARARGAARAAQLELDRLEEILSDWRSDSALSRWNRHDDVGAASEAPPEMRELVARAIDVARASDGRFDPTVLPCVSLWRASRASGRLPDAAELAAARARIGWQALSVTPTGIARLRPGIALDFGGIGKGYAAVRAIEVLRAAGCPRALVAIAGDVAAGDPPRDAPGWVVEIESESEEAGSERVVLANAAVSTSGASAQFVEIDGIRYAHVVDPRTGLGARALAQATVVGPLDAAVDALATALALAEDTATSQAMIDAFPGYRARIERDGEVVWIAAVRGAERDRDPIRAR